jgi:hypothetical protein
VCYTNHALDQFLENLEGRGFTDIVRIGSRSTNPAMDKYSLKNLSRRNATTGSARRRVAVLLQRVRELEESIQRQEKAVTESPCWWRGFQDFVEQSFPHVGQQLRVPEELLQGRFAMVVEKGAKLQSDYLWKRWRQGKSPGALADMVASPRHEQDVWQMDQGARQLLRDQMEKGYLEIRRMELVATMREYDDAKNELSSIYEEDDRAAFLGCRIIGCTTSGVAIRKDLLETLQPGVLLVEEAGEILEAHVLTSLAQRSKHVILIGDHKQLRPKLECYELSVEAGRGHDFNESLFERLVKSGNFPFVTLSVQHRMRPEISALIKPTYPALQDHPSVLERPRIRGLADNLVFIDHRVRTARAH